MPGASRQTRTPSKPHRVKPIITKADPQVKKRGLKNEVQSFGNHAQGVEAVSQGRGQLCRSPAPSTKQHITPAQSLVLAGSALFLCPVMKVYCQTSKACFPRICTGIPRSEKRSRCNAATSGGIFEGISPKVGTSSQVGASKSGLTQPGSRRASQFCDSAIRQTGQGA